MAMISVEEARALVLAEVAVLPAEDVALPQANGRTLARDLAARRTQPPFRASAMDGYAVRAADTIGPDATLRVIGEAPAGRAYVGAIAAGETVRIFTGAPVPEGADAVLIQENTALLDATHIRVTEPVALGRNIRAAGLDFQAGDVLLRSGTRLDWRTLALAAAMNHPHVPVTRRPRVAILATGDELVAPGEAMRADQIVASNSFGVAAFVETAGGIPIDLGIVSDDRGALVARIEAAVADAPDVLVTLGGASVGDHDLVREALSRLGIDMSFWKIAMRPGKPLMFGRLGATRVLGLPGNPVSSLVGAVLFLGPLLRALQGADIAGVPATERARLGAPLKANDSRADYLRGTLSVGEDGVRVATAFDTQDSSMLKRFADSNCLILRAPHAPAAASGSEISIIRV
jgi:molybdopterin molybdotransferase